MAYWVWLRSRCYSICVDAVPRRCLSTYKLRGLRRNLAAKLVSHFPYYAHISTVAVASSSAIERQSLRSPDIVALEYADLNLTDKVYPVNSLFSYYSFHIMFVLGYNTSLVLEDTHSFTNHYRLQRWTHVHGDLGITFTISLLGWWAHCSFSKTKRRGPKSTWNVWIAGIGSRQNQATCQPS